MSNRLDITLKKVSGKFSENGGFRAVVAKDGAYSYEHLLNEVIQNQHLGITTNFLDMVLKATFNTMIEGLMTDGISRRIGDFIQLQLQVRGKFDSEGEDFDEKKHKLAIAVRPLKELRVKPGRDGVSVINRNAGPKVVIERTHSPGLEGNQVKWGEPIEIEGENLFVVERKDNFVFKYINDRRAGFIAMDMELDPKWVSNGGRKLTIPWKAFGDLFEKTKEKGKPIAIMVALRTRGGKATAKTQLHRARAYFDTWLETHPDYADDFSKLLWGSV